jgi:hypothetical protein
MLQDINASPKSRARCGDFAQWLQGDLGCPDGKRKIFGFTRMPNHRFLMAIPPL